MRVAHLGGLLQENGEKWEKQGVRGDRRGLRRERERDAPRHGAGEPGRSFFLFLRPFPLDSSFTYPTIADPRRHTSTFSYSFSVPPLACIEIDDDNGDVDSAS